MASGGDDGCRPVGHEPSGSDALELAPPFRGLAVEPRLIPFFGDPVPIEELAIWAAIPPSRREQALRRVEALERWCVCEDGLTAKAAAADAGVELGRFYQLARAWEARRSLAAIGTFASVSRPRQRIDAKVTNALQAVVARVVRENRGASIARLAELLGDASGLAKEDLPGRNTMRTFVEREQRRLRTERQAGTELLFDYAATSLIRPNGTRHVVFLAIDKGTNLVLGQALGDPARSAVAYSDVAGDALRRIAGLVPGSGIWAPSFERSQLVAGSDGDAVSEVIGRAADVVRGRAPAALAASTHARYIRAHLGMKLGPIRFLPPRSRGDGDRPTPPSERLTESEADGRLAISVADHNDAVLASLVLDGQAMPPSELISLLRVLAHQLRVQGRATGR